MEHYSSKKDYQQLTEVIYQFIVGNGMIGVRGFGFGEER